jgi:hypothetical protein
MSAIIGTTCTDPEPLPAAAAPAAPAPPVSAPAAAPWRSAHIDSGLSDVSFMSDVHHDDSGAWGEPGTAAGDKLGHSRSEWLDRLPVHGVPGAHAA